MRLHQLITYQILEWMSNTRSTRSHHLLGKTISSPGLSPQSQAHCGGLGRQNPITCARASRSRGCGAGNRGSGSGTGGSKVSGSASGSPPLETCSRQPGGSTSCKRNAIGRIPGTVASRRSWTPKQCGATNLPRAWDPSGHWPPSFRCWPLMILQIIPHYRLHVLKTLETPHYWKHT